MKEQDIQYPPQAINIIAGIMASKDVGSPNYLKGPQLVNLFQSLGFPDSYTFVDGRGIQTIDYGEGLSRLAYTIKRLEEINKSCQMPNAIKKFLEKVQAPQEAFVSIQEVLQKFNLRSLNQEMNSKGNNTILTNINGDKLKKNNCETSNNAKALTVAQDIPYEDTTEGTTSIEHRKSKMEKLVLGEIPSGRPVVFISYSWDSDSHKEWVARLADDLTKSGIYVLLDQYLEDGTMLPAFMDLGIERADKVIIVGTEYYKQKSCYPDTGAAFEGCIIRNQIFQNLGTKKFITCLRSGNFTNSFPLILGGCKGHDFRNEDNYVVELDNLCREIWHKPKYQRPSLGDIPDYVKA